jgi:hypothetical protein
MLLSLFLTASCSYSFRRHPGVILAAAPVDIRCTTLLRRSTFPLRLVYRCCLPIFLAFITTTSVLASFPLSAHLISTYSLLVLTLFLPNTHFRLTGMPSRVSLYPLSTSINEICTLGSIISALVLSLYLRPFCSFLSLSSLPFPPYFLSRSLGFTLILPLLSLPPFLSNSSVSPS